MRTHHVIRGLAGLSLCLVMAGCNVSSSHEATKDTVTLFDKDGTRVEVQAPVDRVVSVNSGMTALICALGAENTLVGRDSYSTFPSTVRKVQVVAESSAKCNLELITSLDPDLVIADGMLYAESREKLAMAQIPSYMDSTSDPLRIPTLIRSLGLVLGQDQRAEELVGFVEKHVELIDQRIAQSELSDVDKPKVFWEWNSPYKTASAETDFHKPIAQAGGVNIAAGQTVRTPVMSSEWIISQNPDVIVNRISGDATLEEMKQKRDEIMQRPGWDQINAVKSGRVYVIKADVFLTFRYPVGLSCYAKWFHPELFEDLDPEAIHQEAIETFFGKSEWTALAKQETFVYP